MDGHYLCNKGLLTNHYNINIVMFPGSMLLKPGNIQSILTSSNKRFNPLKQ